MHDHSLESELERLLKYGTIACSALITVGVLLDVLDANLLSVDLVNVGIVGFIALPVLRVLAMLRHYRGMRDVPMMRIVGIVLALVMAGLVLGILW